MRVLGIHFQLRMNKHNFICMYNCESKRLWQPKNGTPHVTSTRTHNIPWICCCCCRHFSLEGIYFTVWARANPATDDTGSVSSRTSPSHSTTNCLPDWLDCERFGGEMLYPGNCMFVSGSLLPKHDRPMCHPVALTNESVFRLGNQLFNSCFPFIFDDFFSWLRGVLVFLCNRPWSGMKEWWGWGWGGGGGPF